MEMEVIENSEQNTEKVSRKVEKSILDSFSKLTNSHENVRAKSAASLLKYLLEKNDEGINELNYALKRLVRGLGAPTPATRTGYFAALVGLLNLFSHISVEEILEILKSELHKSGKNSDGENADICAGQILCCGAIIRSNLWKKCSDDNKQQILQTLISASKERAYLGLFGFNFIIQLIEQLEENEVKDVVFPCLQPEILKPWAEQTLDTLFVLLSIRTRFPNVCSKKLIKTGLGSPDIICIDSLEPLCQVLMTIPRITSVHHPVYPIVIQNVNPKILPNFFYELDKHLKTPNRNRLMVFLKILTNTFSHIADKEEYFDQIPKIFTRNFITQLLGYFRTFKGKQRDKEYQESVNGIFESLLNVLKQEKIGSDTKIFVIKKFLFDPGTFIFEKVTKSKIIQQITATLDPAGVKNLALLYRGITDGTERIDTENDSENWLNNDRLYSAHLLIKLLNLPIMKSEHEWKVEQLGFLMKISLLKETSGMNVGRELAESLKSAFFGALDLKLSKLEELHKILSQLINSLDSKITADNFEFILRTPITSETYALWQKTLTIARKIEKKKKKSGLSSVFLTLFLHMGLQLFNDVKLASDSLNELFSCYERVKKDKKSKHHFDETLSQDAAVDSETDPLWIEVVVDLFLNLLSHSSHLLRSIVKCVFPHLCQYMTSTTVHQIVSVLDSKDEENPLSKNEESSSEDEEESDDEDKEESGEESAPSESEEEPEAEDNENDDETVNDKLRMALHQALQSGVSLSDDESIDLDQMSDSEGEKLDKALADVFRQFRPSRGKNKRQNKDQETLTHFRGRVLDLIEIYLDSTPSMLLTLEIMLPLLQAVEFSIKDEHQKPLNDRLRAILKKLLGLKKFSDLGGVDSQILGDLLASLLAKGSKNTLIVQDMGEQIADCCIFVVKCSEILKSTEQTPKKVKKLLNASILEVLSGELHQFFTKRDCLTPYVLFKSLLQMCWEGNVGLSMILLGFMFDDEIRQFKQNQVAELLKIFYSNQRFLSQNLDKVQSKLLDIHEEFANKVKAFFISLCEDPNKSVKERFICNTFNLLAAMKQCPLNTENMRWQDILEHIREYRSNKSFSRDTKAAFNKLCRSLGVSNLVKMKNKPNNVPSVPESKTIDNPDSKAETEEANQKKKLKKKLNKEKLKLKKQAKQLRLESLSEGLNVYDFKQTSRLDINGDDHDLISDDNEATKLSNGNESDIQSRMNGKKNKKLNGTISNENDLKNNAASISKKKRFSEGHSLVKKKKRRLSE